MSDLKSQLAAAFGVAVPEASPEAPPAGPAAAGVLADDAHLSDPWLQRLRQLVRQASAHDTDNGPNPAAKKLFAALREEAGLG